MVLILAFDGVQILDIAGPARADAARGYQTKGATAYGARTLIEYLRVLAKSPKA